MQVFVIANRVGVLSERTREAKLNGRRGEGCRHDGDARQINQKPVGVKFKLVKPSLAKPEPMTKPIPAAEPVTSAIFFNGKVSNQTTFFSVPHSHR